MFGSIGGAELLFVLVLALMLFGPRQLPRIGRTVGRAMAEFRNASNELRTSLEQEVELEELRRLRDEATSAGREVGDALRPRSAPGSRARDVAGDEPVPAGRPASPEGGTPDPDAETPGRS